MDGNLVSLESMKHDPAEFGGIQGHPLSQAEIQERLCCAQGCSRYGFAQIIIPLEVPEQFRILCKRHYILVWMMTSAAIGDPAPAEEAKRIAELINFDWFAFLYEVEPKHAVQPENFICMNCGGSLVPETVGMYSGKRWIHTCGVDRASGR